MAKARRGGQRAGMGTGLTSLETLSLDYPYNEDGFNSFVRDQQDALKAEGKFNYEDAQEIWIEGRWKKSFDGLKKMDKQEAIDILRSELPQNIRHGWFVEANSAYKPKLVAVAVSNPRVRNAGMNMAHEYYNEYTGKQTSFTQFMNSEITVYRGGNNGKFVADDVFVSYSLDINVAKKFGNNIVTKKVKVKDTLGSFQTNGEYEILVMNRGRNKH